MEKVGTQLLLNIRETLEDFKCLLPRFVEVKENKELLQKFCNRNRNPLFDLTNNNKFKTGLSSVKGLTEEKTVEDHFIQRTKAVKIIFKKLENNPEMEFNEFYSLLKRYCSTISLTKEEHTKVTKRSRQSDNDSFNWEIYEECGIFVVGLDDLIWDIESADMDKETKDTFQKKYENYIKNYANISTIPRHEEVPSGSRQQKIR